MTYKLNGINYTEMLLTDEELAVVKAMREEDSIINVFVNRKNEEEAEEYANSFPNRKDYLDSQVKDFFYSSTLKTSVYANYEKKD
jgi:capsular polysaccharide biosynthesis protein